MTRSATPILGIALFVSFSAMAQPATGTVQLPLVGGEAVAEQTIRDLGLIVVRNGGGLCSGSMLNDYWALTADHCVRPISPSGVSVAPGYAPGQAHQVSRVVSYWSEGYDIALLRLRTPLRHSSTVSLPEVTSRANDRIAGQHVETFGVGINQLARQVGAAWVPASGDQTFRRAVFHAIAHGPESVDLKMLPDSTIAGGDSGGVSYLRLWVDPANQARGTYREIVGVSSLCNVFRRRGHESETTWTWVTRVTNCWIATPGPVRDRIAHEITDQSPDPSDQPPPLFGGGAPVGDGTNRALYSLALDQPLVPPQPYLQNRPLDFSMCSGSISFISVLPRCPHVGGFDVWRYDSRTKYLIHAPSGWCLAPSQNTVGSKHVLVECTPTLLSLRWDVTPTIPGSMQWKAIRNRYTKLCATAQYPRISGQAGQVVGTTAELVARPCNGSNAQRFDAVDAGWSRRNGPN